LPIPRWQPKDAASKQEGVILKRVARKRRLFEFLRLYRMGIFDEAFQAELEGMYRDTGAGLEPIAPALMAMALILQGYLGVSDADAVELTVLDLRWQMVLDRLGHDEPAFSQGALFEFRERMIRTNMDRRLLERTAEVARQTNAFDWRKLPKTLRVAVDSSPLRSTAPVPDPTNSLFGGPPLLSTERILMDRAEHIENDIAEEQGGSQRRGDHHNRPRMGLEPVAEDPTSYRGYDEGRRRDVTNRCD